MPDERVLPNFTDDSELYELLSSEAALSVMAPSRSQELS
jgi:hypothetical protein